MVDSSATSTAQAARRPIGDGTSADPASAQTSSAASSPVSQQVTQRISRRRFLSGAIGGAALAFGGAAYGRSIEPFWLETHDVEMPMKNLPRSFEGFRIVQLSDLHAARNMPLEYLQRAIDRVSELKPDYVVVTGDLVTHAMEWVNPICDALARIKTPMAVSLGNHDYDDLHDNVGVAFAIASAIERRLGQHGIPVLRNRAMPIEHADGRIWLVGLEDLWSGLFAPQVAFAGLDVSQPVIALSHNPDTAPSLDAYGAQWILSGHTHGGQVRAPFYGALILNVRNRQFQQGLHRLSRSHLYISRGIGYLKRIRLNCRPEMPCFVLRGV